jgi:translation initiation factor IF-1
MCAEYFPPSTETVSNYLQQKVKKIFSPMLTDRTILVTSDNEHEFKVTINNKLKSDSIKIDKLIVELNEIFGKNGTAAKLHASDSDAKIGFRIIGDPIAMADCINKNSRERAILENIQNQYAMSR